MATILKGKTFINRFDPSLVSGLQLWLDASDSTTLFQDSAATTPAVADGDPVGCWKDKSGNNYHALQTDGTFKPVRKNAIQNGRDVIRFDGTNDRLVCGDVMDLGTRNLAMFVVVKIVGNRGGVIGKSEYVADTGPFRYVIVRDESLIFFLLDDNAGRTLHYVGDTTSNYQLFTSIFDRLNSSYLRRNKITVSSVSRSNSDDYQSNYVFEIGNYQNPDGTEGNYNPLNGDICEAIVYMGGSALTTSQRDQVENYLANKWGI